MDLQITPSLLAGTVSVPASKSILHRALICAALSQGSSVIENCYRSQDIDATIRCLEQLGAKFHWDDSRILVDGISQIPSSAVLDCGESGSTIRFLIPIAAALGISAHFTGSGKLVTRPLDLYVQALGKQGCRFHYNGHLPAQIAGQLAPGRFTIRGDVSSQFITGLLFALPMLDGNSVLEVLPPFESKSYVDITLSVLASFGITVKQEGFCYYIPGNQQYRGCSYWVESDYSQAAFFLTADCFGSRISLSQFGEHSVQGDSAILSILGLAGAGVCLKDGVLTANASSLNGFSISAEDIPDLVPILCVLACFGKTITCISHVKRLKIKESDRIASTIAMLQALGGTVEYDSLSDCMIVEPCHGFHGGTVDACNDHRIAMAAAVAATRADGPVKILGAQCVAKSYPTFFEEYQALGGICHVVCLD